ncbi:hypothetical protein DSO57_1033923 [Entomophthora muscae]|uniref:Uncharacterized protein n=1 Tax=Entomophthora muscae TaxID=34485 RepID=A0ACC2S235_9FUNG|nr:hypothetical protein DSO57_1033923 [Entomophthora muscae]
MEIKPHKVIMGAAVFFSKKRRHSHVATKFPDSPSNVSYNTQGGLNESPLDVSNVMNESDDNVKWRALSPN